MFILKRLWTLGWVISKSKNLNLTCPVKLKLDDSFRNASLLRYKWLVPPTTSRQTQARVPPPLNGLHHELRAERRPATSVLCGGWSSLFYRTCWGRAMQRRSPVQYWGPMLNRDCDSSPYSPPAHLTRGLISRVSPGPAAGLHPCFIGTATRQIATLDFHEFNRTTFDFRGHFRPVSTHLF